MNLQIPIVSLGLLAFLLLPYQDGGGPPRPRNERSEQQRPPRDGRRNQDTNDPRGRGPDGGPGGPGQMHKDNFGREKLMKIRDDLRRQADLLLRHADEIDEMLQNMPDGGGQSGPPPRESRPRGGNSNFNDRGPRPPRGPGFGGEDFGPGGQRPPRPPFGGPRPGGNGRGPGGPPDGSRPAVDR